MRALAVTLLIVVMGSASADDEEAAALSLADKTPTTTALARDWRVFTEAALLQATQRDGGAPDHTQRLSLDARYDKTFAPNWRATFADRLDVRWYGRLSDQNSVNTLKEAYLSWQPRPERIGDMGRINTHYGVASGYNPTDYFRTGAVRSIVSLDPASLRENRLGSMMLRGQTLWSGGSLTALYSPKLADHPADSAFSPDLGATNNQNRWLVVASQRLSEEFNPEWLIFGQDHASAQFGVNLTALLNDATVAYLEWSGGRSPSLLSQALNSPDNTSFRNRLSTGLTYTAPSKFSLTLEYEYNGAGLDRTDWSTLRQGSPSADMQYLEFAQARQDLPTKQNGFAYALWQDAMIIHLDLSAMQRFDAVDHSRLSWLEARYHWSHVDLALQWQLNSGSTGTTYGASPQREIWQALVTYFF